MLEFAICDLEQCWLHGFKSFHQDIDETANPFPKGTKQAHYWREGWWEACFNTDNLSDVYQNHFANESVANVELMAS